MVLVSRGLAADREILVPRVLIAKPTELRPRAPSFDTAYVIRIIRADFRVDVEGRSSVESWRITYHPAKDLRRRRDRVR